MKIRLDVEGKVFEYEREPMSPERFSAVCKLTGAAIGGTVLLAAIRMVGIWAIVWAVGMLVAIGLYRLFKEI